MRVVNRDFETITEYDVTRGKLVPVNAIREDAAPIDNIVKFAWDDGDYETVMMFVPNRRKESAPQVSETDAAIAELGMLAAENAARLDEQDAALCELAALIAGGE